MFSGVTRPGARQLSFGSCPRIIDPILLGDSVSITNHAFTVPASRLRFFAYFWTEAYLAGSKSYTFFSFCWFFVVVTIALKLEMALNGSVGSRGSTPTQTLVRIKEYPGNVNISAHKYLDIFVALQRDTKLAEMDKLMVNCFLYG